ncbi:hypothetical protein DFH07DRAFT_972773 [Mycena maculata]|uniref:Uncharacterized protein n=1 Tax=Mycena maculata TaxID=230809 RepID=A0AAD7HHC6_9AGAR|nr:hypothetical protein DFH07DRAFT_972773 [Mycena maculata]
MTAGTALHVSIYLIVLAPFFAIWARFWVQLLSLVILATVNTHDRVRTRALGLVAQWTAEFAGDSTLGIMGERYEGAQGAEGGDVCERDRGEAEKVCAGEAAIGGGTLQLSFPFSPNSFPSPHLHPATLFLPSILARFVVFCGGIIADHHSTGITMAPSSKRVSTHDPGISTGTDAGTAASTTLSSAATSTSTSPTTLSRTTPSASTVKISSSTAGNGAVAGNSSTDTGLSTTSAATTRPTPTNPLPPLPNGYRVKAPAFPPITAPARPLKVPLRRPPTLRRVLLLPLAHLRVHVDLDFFHGGRKSGRFLGLGSKDASGYARHHVPDFNEPLSPPSAYGGGTARPHMRSERRPSRLGTDGALTSRLSGWFAHLAGSTSDLPLTSTMGSALSHSVSTASVLASSASKKHSGKGGSKTSLLDMAVRYLFDGDAAPDRSHAEIWLMSVKLPGWGR